VRTHLGALVGLLILLPGLVVAQGGGRFVFTEPHMGTQFRIAVLSADSIRAQKGADAAFARVETLNGRLSDYLSDSEVNRLSAAAGTGRSIPVSDDLWAVLVAAQRMARDTGGLFDPTIGPLTRLWRWASRRGILPPPEAREQAQARTGYEDLVLDAENQTAYLRKHGMRVDLGGIAKGFAADEALSILVDHGLPDAVVDAGGDVALGEHAVWPITLADSVVHLSGCGIAVSGATYRYVEHEGMRYSHILDPRTGLGVTHQRTVAVIAPTAMEADALASAASVMNERELQHYNVCQGLAQRCINACLGGEVGIITW